MVMNLNNSRILVVDFFYVPLMNLFCIIWIFI